MMITREPFHPKMSLAMTTNNPKMIQIDLSEDMLWSLGAPVAQQIKGWPSDLAVLGLSPPEAEIFPTVNEAPLHTAFHYQPTIILI